MQETPMDSLKSLPCRPTMVTCRAVSSISAELRERLSEQTGVLSLERGLDQIADEFAVDGLTGQLSHHRFHDLPHVFER